MPDKDYQEYEAKYFRIIGNNADLSVPTRCSYKKWRAKYNDKINNVEKNNYERYFIGDKRFQFFPHQQSSKNQFLHDFFFRIR